MLLAKYANRLFSKGNIAFEFFFRKWMLIYFMGEKNFKTFPKANNDKKVLFRNSDENLDYLPLPTRPSTSIQEDYFTNYLFSVNQVLANNSTFTLCGARRPLWKCIHHKGVSDTPILLYGTMAVSIT